MPCMRDAGMNELYILNRICIFFKSNTICLHVFLSLKAIVTNATTFKQVLKSIQFNYMTCPFIQLNLSCSRIVLVASCNNMFNYIIFLFIHMWTRQGVIGLYLEFQLSVSTKRGIKKNKERSVHNCHLKSFSSKKQVMYTGSLKFNIQ